MLAFESELVDKNLRAHFKAGEGRTDTNRCLLRSDGVILTLAMYGSRLASEVQFQNILPD